MTRSMRLTLLFVFTGLVASGQPLADSATTVANRQLYEPHSFLRRLLLGSNYREAWQQEVRVPVFRLSTSGFVVEELGGGMQTKSLRLEDSLGRNWALRTVNKKISTYGLSPVLRTGIGRKFSQDFISSSHPYAAPLAGAIAAAMGVNAARPRSVYVADDPALGPYRSLFAGELCTLEERDPGFDDTEDTEQMAENLQRDKRYKVHPTVYLRARLLDMLLADWDRHAGNWRWGLKDSAGFRYYHAVPRDRDWAFYQSGGLMPWLAKTTGAMRYLTGFKPNLKNVKQLSWKAWTMDKFFMGELDRTTWERIISEVQTALSDEAIVNTLQVLPAAIREEEGEMFVRTLQRRRDALREEAMAYYDYLTEEAIVNGADEAETFVLSGQGDALLLRVFRSADTTQPVYERRFVYGETYSLELNGFGGADLFRVEESVSSKIRLRINGGEGADSYQLRGRLRTRVVDNGKPNVLTATGRLAATEQKAPPPPHEAR